MNAPARSEEARTGGPRRAPFDLERVARGGRATVLALCGLAAAAAALLANAAVWLVGASAGWAAAVAAAVATLPLAAGLVAAARRVELGRRQLAQSDPRDALTGLANRTQYLALAEREWARARRYGTGAAVLLLEIDRFRRLTETFGAETADAVLRAVAGHTAPTLRSADVIGRFGSAQLAVFLAHADATGALDAAERLRERCEQMEIAWPGPPLRVTVAVGVATLRPAHDGLPALVEDAQAALQAARHAGGNTVRAAPVDQGELLRRVTDALPNVTGVRVEDILRSVADLLDRIATALAATGSITLVAGMLVLAGASAAGQRGRLREAVVRKTLGATRAQIRAAWLVEFGLLGAVAGVIAAAVGTAASWGVVRFLMASDWVFLPGRLSATVLLCVSLMLLFGYAGTAGALRAKAAPILRND
jgi:diguanylate cyclase (GGDEF)-like protein